MPRAAKAKPSAFEQTVRAASGKSSSKEIGKALGRLVSARLKQRVARTVAPARPTPMAAAPKPARVRRGSRRLGKFQRYSATAKPDVSRYGTFRRYMISTIRAHTDTHSANAAHALCDNPSFAKNRLDFNWAADNGYITFE